jgi:hypothetical protein
MRAIFDASTTEHGPTIINTSAAIDGLIMTAALIASRDPSLSTPGKVRQFAEIVAEKLVAQIQGAQADPSAALLFGGGAVN